MYQTAVLIFFCRLEIPLLLSSIIKFRLNFKGFIEIVFNCGTCWLNCIINRYLQYNSVCLLLFYFIFFFNLGCLIDISEWIKHFWGVSTPPPPNSTDNFYNCMHLFGKGLHISFYDTFFLYLKYLFIYLLFTLLLLTFPFLLIFLYFLNYYIYQ